MYNLTEEQIEELATLVYELIKAELSNPHKSYSEVATDVKHTIVNYLLNVLD